MTNDKIQEWEHMLQNSKTLSKKDKKILRNRISAQKSRNKKKEEFGQLSSKIDTLQGTYEEKLEACTHIFEVLEDNLCLTCKDKVIRAVDTMPYKR